MILKTTNHYRGIAKMIDLNERVAVVETQIKNLDEKIDDLKQEVKANHLDLNTQLLQMAENSTRQHGQLAEKISNLEKVNHGWVMWMLGASAVISAIVGLYNLLK